MSNRPSASGERAAIIGYSAQYCIAAEVIYSALAAGELEWIALADPDAGRVDDIQVATLGRLDAYQVKWGEQIGRLSFNDLTSGNGDPDLSQSYGLIGQLAGGWHKLKRAHLGRRVVVHLVTRDIATDSSSAIIPHDDNTVSKANLQGFLTDCWVDRNWSIQGLGGCPIGWSPALIELKSASGIDEATFTSFIRDCELPYQAHHPHAMDCGEKKPSKRLPLSSFERLGLISESSNSNGTNCWLAWVGRSGLLPILFMSST